METGEFLNMCGHCTIGTTTVVIEAGMIESHEARMSCAGHTGRSYEQKHMVKDGKVESVTLTNVPAFVYRGESDSND